MQKVSKISPFLIRFLLYLVVGSTYAQIPPLSDMTGISGTKFYWGISFEPRGNIRSFKQELFDFKLGNEGIIRGKNLSPKGALLPISMGSDIYVKYDVYGDLIEEKVNGQIIQYINVLDANGNLVERKGYFDLDKDEEPYIKINYAYDAYGNLMEEIVESHNYYKKQTYQYNTNGNIVQIEFTELFGGRFGEFVTYVVLDVAFSLIFNLESDYDSYESSIPNNRHLKILRSYDDNGNLAEESIYSILANQKLPEKFIEKNLYDYDTLGNITEESKIVGIETFWKGDIKQKLHLKAKHIYDDHGYRIESSLDYPISGTKTTANYINNYKGDRIEINEYVKGVSYTAKFEYDRYDNFTKLYIFKQDKPQYMFEREIEYYE